MPLPVLRGLSEGGLELEGIDELKGARFDTEMNDNEERIARSTDHPK